MERAYLGQTGRLSASGRIDGFRSSCRVHSAARDRTRRGGGLHVEGSPFYRVNAPRVFSHTSSCGGRPRAAGHHPSSSSPSSSPSSQSPHLDPSAAYTYKSLRALFTTEQLKDELRARDLPYLGYKTQLAGRLYQALLDEGRALVGEEAMRMDEALPEWLSDGEGEEGGKSVKETFSGVLLENDSESVMSNKTGMQVVFLNGGGVSGGGGGGVEQARLCRVSGSVGLRTLQSVVMFDVGEDTQVRCFYVVLGFQGFEFECSELGRLDDWLRLRLSLTWIRIQSKQRSLIGHTLVDWKRIDRIFISSMDPESVLGLPGMLCTISASRSKGHEAADVPVHVYGPPNLVQFVSSMLAVSRTYLEMPVILHELTPGRVSEADMEIKEVLKRSRLYACKLPPDALNPQGYYDGELKSMLRRSAKSAEVGSASKANDLRAGTLPQRLPGPGDPTRRDVSISNMVWTVRVDSEWVIQASPLKNTVPAFGFKAIESDRSGRLYPAVAQALGVFDSKQYADLKSGRSVFNEQGEEIRPEECVGPNRRGRTVGIVPSCVDSELFARNMVSVDLLIHGMTSRVENVGADGRAIGDRQGLVSLGKKAGACAKALGARELVLWQAQTSFLDLEEEEADALVNDTVGEAKAVVGEEVDVVMGGAFPAHQWTVSLADERPPDCPEDLQHLM
jgi:ribonuclease BN (tRNA processing enzyme)